MRTLCDSCESASAVLFCAADEAALCPPCDDKVHKCNKLASRHLRVGLADPNDVPRCDICENAPAFFYCEVDGTSLCLQCDMVAHVGGKRTHARYLVLRQRIEFPGDKLGDTQDPVPEPNDPAENGKRQYRAPRFSVGEGQQNHMITLSPVQKSDANGEGRVKAETNMIDLNIKPHRVHEHGPTNQEL